MRLISFNYSHHKFITKKNTLKNITEGQLENFKYAIITELLF